MEGGDLATSAIVTPTTVAQLVTSQQSSASSTVPVTTSGGATGQPTFGQQQLIRQQVSMIESLAHNLADEALNEALEAYLMRQVQETAEETMRAAFAAATGGATVKRQDDGGEPSSESGASLSTRGDRRAASQGMADDEMSYGEDDNYGDDDDDGDDDTLNAHLQIDHNNTVSRQTSASELSASDDPLRKSSTSPSRLDGRDIFQDLSEMANYADRIDSILEQSASEHSTRSGSHLGGPSSSGGAWPNARRPRSVSPFLGNDNYRAAGIGFDGGDDDLDDGNEELD